MKTRKIKSDPGGQQTSIRREVRDLRLEIISIEQETEMKVLLLRRRMHKLDIEESKINWK